MHLNKLIGGNTVHCGHHCHGLWPSLSTLWPRLSRSVAIIAAAIILYHVAEIVTVFGHHCCGHHCLPCGRDCHSLWPSLLWPSLSTLWPRLSWFVAIIAAAIIVYPVAEIVTVFGHHCCGHYCLPCGRDCHGLWPSLLRPSLSIMWLRLSRFAAIIFCGRHCCWMSLHMAVDKTVIFAEHLVKKLD